MSCVFCPDNWDNLDIVNRGTIDGQSYAIVRPLDPVTEGHLLVIGDQHSKDAASNPLQAMFLMGVAAGEMWTQGIQANIITSIGPDATQTVMHTHLHVVPRRKNDHLPLPWTPQHERKAREAAECERNR